MLFIQNIKNGRRNSLAVFGGMQMARRIGPLIPKIVQLLSIGDANIELVFFAFGKDASVWSRDCCSNVHFTSRRICSEFCNLWS